MNTKLFLSKFAARVAPFVLLVTVAPLSAAQDFDILIHGGHIADGTGNPAFYGDLGILHGRIAAMGHLSGKTARREIDASGLTVAPGFIDIHNHSDYSLLVDGRALSMIYQGVTTMILGEGESAGPVGGKQEPSGRHEDWTDFNGYFARLMRQGISTNIGSYVGRSEERRVG